MKINFPDYETDVRYCNAKRAKIDAYLKDNKAVIFLAFVVSRGVAGRPNGCKTLYLGGVGSGEDSLFKCREAFYRGDDLPCFHIGRKVWDAEMYQYPVSLRNDVPPESCYFPVRRACSWRQAANFRLG